MSERTQRLSLFVFVALLSLGVVVALKFTKTPPLTGLQPTVAQPFATNVSTRLTKITLTSYEKGKRVWIVRAPLIESDQSRDKLMLSGGVETTLLDTQTDQPQTLVRSQSADYLRQAQEVQFTGGLIATILEEKKTRATLTAPNAHYTIPQKKLEASGGVFVRVEQPKKNQPDPLFPRSLGAITLTAQALLWSETTKIIQFPGPARLIDARGDEAWGKNLTLNTSTRDIQFEEFRGKILIPKDTIE
jgi:hypothetical protein